MIRKWKKNMYTTTLERQAQNQIQVLKVFNHSSRSNLAPTTTENAADIVTHMKAVIITLMIMKLTFKSPNLPAGSRKG